MNQPIRITSLCDLMLKWINLKSIVWIKLADGIKKIKINNFLCKWVNRFRSLGDYIGLCSMKRKNVRYCRGLWQIIYTITLSKDRLIKIIY